MFAIQAESMLTAQAVTITDTMKAVIDGKARTTRANRAARSYNDAADIAAPVFVEVPVRDQNMHLLGHLTFIR